MVRSLIASLAVSASGMTCPGSPAAVHAGIKITATAQASCDVVKAEMKARVAGKNGWYDQHNRGTYTEQSYGGDFSASRVTGDGKYTDKIVFDLTDDGNNCKIEGCSQSQVFSIADFGTNYCEVKLLYCGSDEGCNVANSDFTNSGESTKTEAGASTGMSNCLKAVKAESKGSCSAADQAALADPQVVGDKQNKCGTQNLGLTGIQHDGFVSCVQSQLGISAACSECYYPVAKYGFDNCKAACLLGWCKSGCLSCTQPAQDTLAGCAGFAPAAASPCEDQVV